MNLRSLSSVVATEANCCRRRCRASCKCGRENSKCVCVVCVCCVCVVCVCVWGGGSGGVALTGCEMRELDFFPYGDTFLIS